MMIAILKNTIFIGQHVQSCKNRKSFTCKLVLHPLKLIAILKCFCTQGLKNSDYNGKYCTASSILQVSVFVLTSILAKALCFYGRVGTEYNSLTANNVRRFCNHGSLTSRSPNFIGKV